jgi:hypothetical protein
MSDRPRWIPIELPDRKAATRPPRRRLAHPDSTTALEASALLAINEAQSFEHLVLEWSEIVIAFRAADADIPSSIKARFLERRASLSRYQHWWTPR